MSEWGTKDPAEGALGGSPLVHVPARPRLADHVAARRHVVAGAHFVTLHDERTGRVAQIGLREWAVLSCLDGTRDVVGLVAATALSGAPMTADQLGPFVQALADSDMLAEGVPRVGSAETPPEDRRLEALPFGLHCDGRGACCRMYLTVPMAPDEAARASAHLPAGLEVPFTPERGATLGPRTARAVTMIDGRCCFLDAADRCDLHASGLKPHGCTLFPAQLVDDGRRVRVAPAPECGCVFDSAERQGGAPLLPDAVRSRSDLDPRTFVLALDDEIAVTNETAWSRDRFLDWSEGLAPKLAGGDAARKLWWLADALESGAAPSEIGEWVAIDRAALDAEAAVLRGLLARRLALHAYRAAADLAHAVPRWMHAALGEPLADEPRADRREAFYLRALWHVHAFASDAPLAAALRRRALRLLVARALPEAMARMPLGRDDTALAHPLALVEAYCRAYGA